MQASRGIVAGSAMATSELKLVLIDVVRQHNVLHPGISLRIFVDDISLDLDNAHLYDLVDQLSDAASTLAHQVENRIGLPIARDKSAIVCSSARVSRALRHRLRELGGPPLGAARNLGVDFAGGNKFGKFGLQTRRSRWIKARTRWHRVSTLSKTNKAAAAAVVVSGINVSLLFDAPVLGCFGRGLDVIRKKTGRLLGVAGCKRNTNLGFSFLRKTDPEVCSSVACVKRLCAEVWEAGLPPRFRGPRAMALGDLAIGIHRYLEAHKRPPKEVVGPLSAAHKCLFNAGWDFAGPFNIVSRAGKGVFLTRTCPRQIADLYRNDLCEVITTRGIVKLHCALNNDESKRLYECGVFIDPLVKLHDSLPSGQARALRDIVSNGVFTKADYFDFGYNIDPVCDRCQEAYDSVYHRCFTCTHSTPVAIEELGDELFQEVLSAGPGSLLATRLLAPHPVLRTSPAAGWCAISLTWAPTMCSWPPMETFLRMAAATIQRTPLLLGQDSLLYKSTAKARPSEGCMGLFQLRSRRHRKRRSLLHSRPLTTLVPMTVKMACSWTAWH